MFVISQSPTFKQAVYFTLLNEKGSPIKHSFTAIYKRPTVVELEQIAKDVTLIDEATGNVKTSDLELMHNWMVGWEGVRDLDEENKEVAIDFDQEAQNRLFTIATLLPAAINAFFDGAKGAKAKNS